MNFKRELLLSASMKSFKKSSTHGTRFDKNYKKKVKDSWDLAWSRDEGKCFYCEFQASDFQEIHHLDDNHDNNSLDNLVTVCPLCHACFHLDVASSLSGGKIIWLPEMSQQELNHLSRAIFIAIDEVENITDNTVELPGFVKIAKMLETTLEERSLIVDQNFKSGASDPMEFAAAMLKMSREQLDELSVNLSNFKLLNLHSRFPVQIKFWRKKTFKDLPVTCWDRLAV